MKIDDLFVKENSTIKDTMKTIDLGGIGIVFIINENKKLVGVATDGDIRRALLKGISLEEKIKKIMNTSPIIAKKDWSENQIKNLLKTDQFRLRIPIHGTMRIPVVDENNRVIDIIFASEERCERDIQNQVKFEDKIKQVKSVNKILVVGGAGYLGSILCRKLIEKDYIVRVLDNLIYGDDGIKDLYKNPKFKFMKGDMRDIQTVVDAVKNVDAVIHLAAIVGDPASELDPEETIEINYLGTKMLAEICKYSQINRFIFASTCSIYGASATPETKIDEKSSLNPVSLYAEMKLKSELGIIELIDENFSPTILRMATLFGLSPRMRFDLVINILTVKALKEKQFTIFGGSQWRPNLHVSDAAEAYIKCLEAPIDKIKGGIFNVGSNLGNYKIIDIGKIVNKLIPEANMIIDTKEVDKRNYNVSFDKIENNLNYHTKYNIEDGIKEIIEAIKRGEFSNYSNSKYSNYKFLQNKDGLD